MEARTPEGRDSGAGDTGAADLGSGAPEDEQDEVADAVLEFVRGWPSKYPSPARIAQAIGMPPSAVIDALARIRARGDYPASDVGAPPVPPVPASDGWDRAN
jgi:hypothetical protein